MRGLMMETPLLVSSIIRHAALNHSDTEIVSRNATGETHRYTYADAYRVIKSGGEWISSIALENLAVGHPAIR